MVTIWRYARGLTGWEALCSSAGYVSVFDIE